MEAITISPFAFTKKRWDQSTSCEMGTKHTECDTICKDTTYVNLLYTYKKYPLILPIFLHKNTKSCITLLAFSDSVSPSSIVYPRRTTFTLVLYLGKTRQRAGI